MKHSKKLLSLVLAILMLVTIFVGCRKQEGNPADTGAPDNTTDTPDAADPNASGSEPAKKDTPVIGMTLRDTTNQTYIKQVNAMQEKCDEYGIKLIVEDAQEDLSKQISQIENFMAMEVDYIFVNVFDAGGIEDTINKAADAGFFVVTHDATFEKTSLTFGEVDNFDYGYGIGQLAAEYINSVDALKNAETVAWALQTYSTVVDLVTRGDGTRAAMEELAPNAKLVTEQDVYSLEESVNVTENMIQAHPDLKLVLGSTDSFVYGCDQAFKAAGFVGDQYGLFGCDGTDAAFELIADDGSPYRGTVALSLVDTSKELIDVLWDHYNGGEAPDAVYFDLMLVTAENVAEFQ